MMNLNKTEFCRYNLFCLIIPLLTLAFWGEPISYSQAGSASEQPVTDYNATKPHYVRVVQMSPEQVILEFNPPAPQFKTSLIDNHRCDTARIPGLVQTETPGLPSLPVQGAMLGIPPDAQPTIQVLSSKSAILPGSNVLVLHHNPSWIVHRPAVGNSLVMPIDVRMRMRLTKTYHLRLPKLSRLATCVASATLRFASTHSCITRSPTSCAIFPVFKSLCIFNAPKVNLAVSPEAVIDEGPFDDSLREMLVNYDQARLWRKQPTLVKKPKTTYSQNQPAYKILINQDGLHQISYADLQKAGCC